MLKKVLMVLVVFSILVLPLFSAEWYENMPVEEIKYSGNINVSQSTLNNLTKKFIGLEFTDEVINEIDTLMYSQDWIDYYFMSAEQNEDGGLVLDIEVQELPMVGAIEFVGNTAIKERALSPEQNITVGSFFSPGTLRANRVLLEDYYKGKGYKDATVNAKSTTDEETNKVTVTYEISEGYQYKISSITFSGIGSISAKELEKQMDSKERSFFRSGNFIQSQLDADLVKIIQFYNTNGYIDAKINSVDIADAGTEDGKYSLLAVTIDINEGELWRLGEITFSGNSVFSDDEIRSLIYLKSGIINNSEQITTQLQEIASLYYNNGYIQTSIIPSETRDQENHTVSYHLDITESSQSVIEEIVITGLTKTKPYVFEREMELKVGDVFSQAKLQKSGQNIMNTSIVTDIKTGLYQGKSENGVILELAVEEGNQMELSFGATFGGTVDGFPVSGFLQWSDKNLMGTGRDFSVSTNLSPDTQSLYLSISDDWVGDKRWSNGISLSVERAAKTGVLQRAGGSTYFDGRDKDKVTFPKGYSSALEWYQSEQATPQSTNLMNYDFYSITGSYSTGYKFMFDAGSLSVSGGLSIGLSHAIYDANYDPYEYIIKKYNEKWQFSNKLSTSLTWDGRDLINNTTSGYVLSASYTYAGGILGGLSNYNKISLSAAGYRSLARFTNEEGKTKHLVLSLTSQVSFMLPQYWNNTDSVGWGFYDANKGATKYEMLYIDGMNVGRGHSLKLWNSFLWHNQVELSYALVENVISAEAYLSATAITEDLNSLSFNNLGWYFSAGAGIKLKIPGFPLGLYLCKTSSLVNGVYTWDGGPIFGNSSSGSGLKLVLAITTSIY